MTTFIRPDANFDWLLDDVARNAVAFDPNIVRENKLPKLVEAANNVPYQLKTLSRVRDNGSKLDLQYQECRHHDMVQHAPVLVELGQELGWQVRHHARRHKSCRDWEPNDLALQRYRDGNDHLGAHQDFTYDLYLNIVVTLEGYATVEVLDPTWEQVVRSYETRPGSVFILWSPSFDSGPDRRLPHRVYAPRTGRRTVAIFRMLSPTQLRRRDNGNEPNQ